jgi:hypothetical protein
MTAALEHTWNGQSIPDVLALPFDDANRGPARDRYRADMAPWPVHEAIRRGRGSRRIPITSVKSGPESDEINGPALAGLDRAACEKRELLHADRLH